MTAIAPLSPPSSTSSAPLPASSEHNPSSKQQLQRVRRKAPKVKTGCLNCRTRHVKCDETHPVCKKCQKSNHACTYVLPTTKSISRARHAAVKFQPLISKAFEKPALSFGTREVRAGPRFTDEHEARYFVYYCEGFSKKIGGPFRSKLWAQLVPQAGESTPFIGRAVIALGALSLSLSQPQDRAKGENHHQYALNQYVRALQGMRKSIKDRPHDVRTALIGCLLIFIFESLQGHQAAASSHASSGSNLITSMCGSRCAPKAWHDSELGEELYSAFSGLNLQSLLFENGAMEGGLDHGFFKGALSEAVRCMPECFDELEECRRFWHYIMRRNLHFCREVAVFFSTFPGCEGKEEVKALKAERDRYVAQICRWEIASARILCQLFTSGDEEEEFLIACLLRIHAAMSIILLTRAFNPGEMEYDKFNEQFRTIVDLSERIHHLLVSDENEGGTFRFEVGILPALSLVTLLCRERELRGRAIELLGMSKGYREGIWDADTIRAVKGWVRAVEEEGLVDGERVIEEKRVSILGCEMRLDGCWAKVRIRHADGVEREGLVRW